MSLAFPRDFARHRLGLLGLGLIAALVAFCFLGPLLHPTDQLHTNIDLTNVGPSGSHPLGTDSGGYDVLGRLMVGGRASLEIGAAVARAGDAARSAVGSGRRLHRRRARRADDAHRRHAVGAAGDLRADLPGDDRATDGATADRRDRAALVARPGAVDPQRDALTAGARVHRPRRGRWAPAPAA